MSGTNCHLCVGMLTLSGHCVYAVFSDERLEQPGLRSHDPNLAFRDLDALGERAQVVAAIAAALKADALAGGLGEGADHLRSDGLGAGVVEHGLGAFGAGLRLVP